MSDQSLAWYSSPRRWLRAVLLLDDTPHSIALGTAIGVFIAFTPTVGVQMLMVGLVAFLTHRLFHFNRLAALLMVYITNPLTVVPIYWGCYRLGATWFPSDITREDFEHLLHYEGFDDWWATVVELFVGIGLPLIVGSLIIATVCAVLSYPTILWLLRQVRGERALRGLASTDSAAGTVGTSGEAHSGASPAGESVPKSPPDSASPG